MGLKDKLITGQSVLSKNNGGPNSKLAASSQESTLHGKMDGVAGYCNQFERVDTTSCARKDVSKTALSNLISNFIN